MPRGGAGRPWPCRGAGADRRLRAEQGEAFAARLLVLPDFHGNRSPLADPHALGVISGLTSTPRRRPGRLYFATAQGIAFGTRHILDALNAEGYAIDRLHVAGGHTRNPLLMELYADATGCTVVAPPEDTDAVLLGHRDGRCGRGRGA